MKWLRKRIRARRIRTMRFEKESWEWEEYLDGIRKPSAGISKYKKMINTDAIFIKAISLADEMSSAKGLQYSEGNMPVDGKEVIISQFQALPSRSISQRSEECTDEFCPRFPGDDRLLQHILSKVQDSDPHLSCPDSIDGEPRQNIDCYSVRLAFEDGEEIGLVLYKTGNGHHHQCK